MKKPCFPIGYEGKMSDLKKRQNKCVGRQQEGKSGQQRIEVKATWAAPGALRLAAYLLKRKSSSIWRFGSELSASVVSKLVCRSHTRHWISFVNSTFFQQQSDSKPAIMRGFGLLAIISCVWILLVLLLSVEAVPLAGKTGEDSGMPTEPEKMVNKTTSVYDYVTPEVMSTVVGAALGDQDCLRYSACKAGNYVADVTGKEIVLMVLDRWVPNSWQGTLRAFKEAATYKDDCKKQFPCSNPQQE